MGRALVNQPTADLLSADRSRPGRLRSRRFGSGSATPATRQDRWLRPASPPRYSRGCIGCTESVRRVTPRLTAHQGWGFSGGAGKTAAWGSVLPYVAGTVRDALGAPDLVDCAEDLLLLGRTGFPS